VDFSLDREEKAESKKSTWIIAFASGTYILESGSGLSYLEEHKLVEWVMCAYQVTTLVGSGRDKVVREHKVEPLRFRRQRPYQERIPVHSGREQVPI
jgi:hypothetical protein